jgi:methylenetetrahydrofolate/methylenetetrahydromethanopterin dehydrogenase (NADP+)
MRARANVPGTFSLQAERGVLANVRYGPCIDTINGVVAAGPRNVAPSRPRREDRFQLSETIMTKKLLFLLDTDPVPSVFDTVVGYDGGADHIIGYGGVTPESAGPLVDGTIYTRGPKEKQYTAIFVGGGNMVAGEAVFKAVKKHFFSNFRVSVMLDSNGSNTTAAAGVALLAKAKPLAGKKAIVLAGTGPVGMRAAAMLHIEGAEVAITSRSKQRADAASKAINDRFGFAPTPIEAIDNEARAAAVKGTHVVFAAGAIGVLLLDEKDWQNNPTIELLADCNAQPPLGIGGVEAIDKAKERHGKIAIGALGLGGLKLKLHRACIGQLFESSDQVLDAENIYAQAKILA